MSLKIKVHESNTAESYVHKLADYATKYNCATITAFRNSIQGVTDGTSKEVIDYTKTAQYQELGKVPRVKKREWNRKLKAALLSLGYGVTAVKGCFKEGGWAIGEEESFFVVDTKNSKDFASNIIKLGEAYNQDCVLIKEYDRPDAYVHGTNTTGWPGYKESVSVGELEENVPIDSLEAWTKLRGQTFAFVNKNPEETLLNAMETLSDFNGMAHRLIAEDCKDLLKELNLSK